MFITPIPSPSDSVGVPSSPSACSLSASCIMERYMSGNWLGHWSILTVFCYRAILVRYILSAVLDDNNSNIVHRTFFQAYV